jgi:hypothetical protein
MSKFKIKITTPEQYDGEYANIIIEAVRTGRRWISRNVTDTECAMEQADVLEDYLNDGNKLVAGDWWEIDRDGCVIYS